MSFLKSFSVLAVVAMLGVQETRAQWTYTSATATGDCAALPAALNTNFSTAPVVSAALFPTVAPYRVNKMAFMMNPTSGRTDIYMTEKGVSGTQNRVLYYNGTASTLTNIGTIPNVNYGGGGVDEQGVWGIALNHNTFAADNFIYVIYSFGAGNDGSATVGWRISRFKLDATTKMINLTSEKVLIHIPAGTTGRWHTGGAMTFDNFGNLYVTTGDNESEAMGPANTADLRGATLRIRPDSTTAKGYTIPAGNFGEYWSAEWTKQGRTALATAYRDTAIVKPEIYIKGSRNPYGMSVDKNRLGWVAWSECGPDAQRGEEYNLAKNPAYSGWPFFVSTGQRQTAFAGSYNETPEPNTAALWAIFNPATNVATALANNWAQALGVDSLPPMHMPTHTLASGCAQGGAIVRYNGKINNPAKLPPHLNNSVFYGELNSTFFGVKFDTTTGANVGTVATVFTMAKTGRPNLNNPVDMQQGPDGALYVTDWGGGCCSASPAAASAGIVRVSYTGTCQDTALYPGGGSVVGISRAITRSDVHWLRVGGQSFSVMSEGPHEVRILDAQGRSVNDLKGQGWKDYDMPTNLSKNSIYYLHVKTEQGTAVRAFVHQ